MPPFPPLHSLLSITYKASDKLSHSHHIHHHCIDASYNIQTQINSLKRQAVQALQMADPRPLRVLIAGAGIGGLATAISLARIAGISNIDVQLYEQAPELREIGASIALSPNVGALRRVCALAGMGQ